MLALRRNWVDSEFIVLGPCGDKLKSPPHTCRLTQDFVFQKYPSLLFKDMLKLDLPNCGLKNVDLSPVNAFIHLSRYVRLTAWRAIACCRMNVSVGVALLM